jgi:DNA-binding transcriptional ArsR family regulator
MEREWLEQELAAGRSIESIAREVGKDPSTVSYWVRKFGLRSEHAERHASRGGIARDTLIGLVERGLTTREIAEELGVSQATVRHWLARHDLRTAAAASRAARRAPAGEDETGVCPIHGETEFRRRPDGYWRCLQCRSMHVSARRRRIKQVLVAEAGGCCVLCGYDATPAALHFHHVDPSTKRFHLAYGGFARSLDVAREEAAKCVLLCANCHAEVETGIATITAASESSPG